MRGTAMNIYRPRALLVLFAAAFLAAGPGGRRGMRRRALLLLTTMALALTIVSGTALADEPQLDQSFETRNGNALIDVPGAYQTVKPGTTGTLDKIDILVGCCDGSGTPSGDLKVTVTEYTGTVPKQEFTIPKEEFTNDGGQSFHWKTITLNTPIPVQDGKYYAKIALNNTSSTGSNYMWANNSSGGYSGGKFYDCYYLTIGGKTGIPCDEQTSDANFRTYVTPGPDTVPPITDLPSAEGGFSNGPPQGSTRTSPKATFKFYSDESGSTFECKMDDGDWETCTSPKEYTGLSDGSHTFQVRATDQPAGNTDPTPESRQWYVDTTPPETTIDSHPSDPSEDPKPIFTFSSNETLSEDYGPFQCRDYLSSEGGEGTSWGNCRSPIMLGGISGLSTSGSYTFEVRAVDKNRLVDPTPASYTWTFTDTTAPKTTIYSGPANGSTTTSTSASFWFGSEGGATLECRLDDEAFEDCTGPPGDTWKTYSDLSNGSHTFQVRATDKAGNVEDPPVSRTWTVDRPLPDTTIEDPPEGYTFPYDHADIYFTSSQSGSTFECSLDSGDWSTCGSQVNGSWNYETFTGLANGPHNIKVRAKNANGTDDTPASLNFNIDAPVIPQVPSIAGTDPYNGDTGVSRTIKPTVTFSTDLKADTVNPQNVKMQVYNAKKKRWVTVPSTPSYADKVVTVTPANSLGSQKKYRVVLKTGIKSSTDDALEKEYGFRFTTRK